MCNSGGWGCSHRGTYCPCNAYWVRCSPQYGSTCPTHLCNVQTGGVISASRPVSKWTDDPLTKNTVIRMNHLTEIRNALNNELTVRGLNRKTWENPGVGFTSTQWLQIRDAINECRTYDKTTEYYNHSTTEKVTAVTTDFTFSESFNVGKTISASGTQQIRQFLGVLQITCICNCNHNCTCNCNYCTCHCNFCHCNSNWGCTCQCAYSDERLKENIEDLNSFNFEETQTESI